MAKSLNSAKAKAADFGRPSLSASRLCAELNVSILFKDPIERLLEAGLLPELNRSKVLRYLRSAKAVADLASLAELASALTKAE